MEPMTTMAIGMAVYGAISSFQASKDKARAERLQYNNQMMQQSVASGVQMFGAAQANVNRMMANKNIAEAALENYINQTDDIDASYQTNMINMSKQLETQTQRSRRVASRKLGRNSGTYELMIDKMKESGAAAFETAAANKYEAEERARQEQRNRLASRDLMSYNLTTTNVPGLPPVVPNHTAAAVQGGISGAATGINMAIGLKQGLQDIQSLTPPTAPAAPTTYAGGGTALPTWALHGMGA